MYVQYNHHGARVVVREDLKGRHQEFCLCYDCSQFKPMTSHLNCRAAQQLFDLNKRFGLTTPVFECPDFQKA